MKIVNLRKAMNSRNKNKTIAIINTLSKTEDS